MPTLAELTGQQPNDENAPGGGADNTPGVNGQIDQSENETNDADGSETAEEELDLETQALLDEANAELDGDITLTDEETSKYEDPNEGPDGSVGDGSAKPVRPVTPAEAGVPALNMDGYRYMFVDPKGNITRMDSETAKMFYENPKFYSYTYNAGTGNGMMVSLLRWCSEDGQPCGGPVGEPYERNA